MADGDGSTQGGRGPRRLAPGTGAFQLNGRTLDEYFTTRAHRMVVSAPLRLPAGRRTST